MATKLGRLVIELATNSARFVRGIESVDRRLERFGKNAQRIGRIVGAAFVLRELGQLGQEIVQVSDKYKLLEGRLKLVQREGESLSETQDKLLMIANATRTDVGSTTDLYTRFARTTKQLNVNQADLLKVTQAVNQAIIVSGASSESAQAAIIQLSQGLAAGALRGQELNSVMEQTPRLSEAIAAGLGITIGQLREFGAAGKLTAESIFNAIVSQAPTIASEYAKMPRTVGQAFQLLKTELEQIAKGFTRFNALVLRGVDNLRQIASAIGEFIDSGARAEKAQRLFNEQIKPNIDLLKEYGIRLAGVDPSNLDRVNDILRAAKLNNLDLVKSAQYGQITGEITKYQNSLQGLLIAQQAIKNAVGESSPAFMDNAKSIQFVEGQIDALIKKYAMVATAEKKNKDVKKINLEALKSEEELIRANFTTLEKLNNEVLRQTSLYEGRFITFQQFSDRVSQLNKDIAAETQRTAEPARSLSGVDSVYSEQLKSDHDAQQKLLEQDRAYRYQLFRQTVDSKERLEALERQRRDFYLDSAASLFGNLAAIVGSGSKKQFELSKKLARAEVIVSTYSSAQKAYEHASKFGGAPAGAVAAAVAISAGLARLAAINRTSFSSSSAASAATGAGSFVPANQSNFNDLAQTNPATGQTFIIISDSGQIDETQLDQLLERVKGRINEGSQVIIRRDSVQAQEIAQAVIK